MTFRYKLLLTSIALPFLLFPLLAMFWSEDMLNRYLIYPILFSFLFMITSLLVYKFDNKNNKRILEKYNKNNKVQGKGMLEAIFNKFRNDTTDREVKIVKKIKFSDLPLGSKILKVVLIIIFSLILAIQFYAGLKILIDKEIENNQKNKIYIQEMEKEEMKY